MDLTEVKMIRDGLNDCLDRFRDMSGLDVKLGRATYTKENVTFKLVLSERKSGHVMTPEVTVFQRRCHQFGLSRNDLWKKVTYNGRTWEIIGLYPRKRRFPIVCQDENHNILYFHLALAHRLLAEQHGDLTQRSRNGG